jgi:hypothetical protein
MTKATSDLLNVCDTDTVTDPVSKAVLRLIADGHLTTYDQQHWLAESRSVVTAAKSYWNSQLSGGSSYNAQATLYEVASRMLPENCGKLTLDCLREVYEKLRSNRFPKELIDGLKSEAAAAIDFCAGKAAIWDVVNFWDKEKRLFPSHAQATSRLALMLPSEASVERVFSRLKAHFTLQQMATALEDMVEGAIMLDYNKRKIIDNYF